MAPTYTGKLAARKEAVKMRLDFSDAPYKIVASFALLKYRYADFFRQLEPLAGKARLVVEFDNYDFSYEQITEVFAACEGANLQGVFRLDPDLNFLPDHYWEAAKRRPGLSHSIPFFAMDERIHDETVRYLSNYEQYRNIASGFAAVQSTVKKAFASGARIVPRTLVTRANLSQIGNIFYRFMEVHRLLEWELVHLVAPYRVGINNLQLEPVDFEDIFNFYYIITAETGALLRIEEAPHYRRFFLKKIEAERTLAREGKHKRDVSGAQVVERIVAMICRDTEAEHEPPKNPSPKEFGFRSIGAGCGECYINGMGEMYPSRFIDTRCGNVFAEGLCELYRGSQPMVSLRNRKTLSGKCGLCGFKQICGGSRARASIAKKSSAAEDPACDFNYNGQ